MPPRLNLAQLTPEELQALLGEEAAQQRLPDVSRARLEHRPLPGPPVAPEFQVQPLEERPWGATPEQARALAALDAALLGAGAQPAGVYYLPLAGAARHVRAYELAPDTALSVRWSETPDSPRAAAVYLEILSWLRDRASGFACVLSSSMPFPLAPAPSEEVDVHLHPGVNAEELLGLHRQHVLMHGRAQKLAAEDGWCRVWRALHVLNITAWTRRDLLLDEDT